jgi:serine/threonine protein kinase
MLSSLSYCHSLYIIHQDVRTENIIITYDNQIKLIDFGHSKQVEYTFKSTKTPVGTWIYRSPEILKELEYSTNTDAWNLVLVILKLIVLKHPFSYSQYNYSTMIIQTSHS